MKRSKSPCICQNIRRAANVVTAFYDSVMKPLGITANQYSILRHVQVLAPCTTTKLAEAMGLERTTLTRNLKPLTQAELLEDFATSGQRDHQYQLTGSGEKLLKKALPRWEKSQKQLQHHIGEKEMILFMKVLFQLEEMQDEQ